MKLDKEYLYQLLPAYYRIADDEQGLPLKALMEVFAREAGIVEDHITQLYEDWFIETCEEWVVPYIGDLLGVRNIHEIEGALYSRRAYVANTLSYRRRKGTAPMMEQLAFDVTGWRSKVLEFFEVLGTNQNLNHIRLHNPITPDLRAMNTLDLIDSPFETMAHNVEVGRISKGLGQYNISNLGIFLWRLQAYPISRSDARHIPQQGTMLGDGYTFSPLGLDTQLFNTPQTEEQITHLAEEINVPGLLRRRGLHDELDFARQTIAEGGTPEYVFFQEKTPAFQLYLNGSSTPVPAEEIVICNLKDWKPAPSSKTYTIIAADGSITSITLPITAAVDPVLGRMTFSNPANVQSVIVDYTYGFSGDTGGGPYDRRLSLRHLHQDDIHWHVGVSQEFTAVAGETIHTSLQAAIQEWNSLGNSRKVGLITIMDSRSYQEAVTGAFRIQIPEGKSLFIIAAEWEETDNGLLIERKHGDFNPERVRPHFQGDWEIEGTAPAGSQNGGSITIDGIVIEGKVTIVQGNLETASIQNSTLVPYMGGMEVMQQDGAATFTIQRSITGPIHVASPGALLKLIDSIIDEKSGVAIDIPEAQLGISQCTIWGVIQARQMDAENAIFNNLLLVERRQMGCIRFSYVLPDSLTPKRYRCQPDLEIQMRIKEAESNGPISNAEKQIIRQMVLNFMFPSFNSTVFGHYAYAQLSQATPYAIQTGAENAAEMGVWNFLQQPQREANLKIVLDEYLRLGLEAGIIYVT